MAAHPRLLNGIPLMDNGIPELCECCDGLSCADVLELLKQGGVTMGLELSDDYFNCATPQQPYDALNAISATLSRTENTHYEYIAFNTVQTQEWFVVRDTFRTFAEVVVMFAEDVPLEMYHQSGLGLWRIAMELWCSGDGLHLEGQFWAVEKMDFGGSIGPHYRQASFDHVASTRLGEVEEPFEFPDKIEVDLVSQAIASNQWFTFEKGARNFCQQQLGDLDTSDVEITAKINVPPGP